jgi:hypothetical protein
MGNIKQIENVSKVKLSSLKEERLGNLLKIMNSTRVKN